MKPIPLTNSHLLAFVDDDDFEKVNTRTWRLAPVQNSELHYVVSGQSRDGDFYALHRFILNLNGKEIVDHIDRSGLNNCKNNLRIVTRSVNSRNAKTYKNNSLGSSGIRLRNGRYQARTKVAGKLITLGTFSSLDEAQRAVKENKQNLLGVAE